MFEKRKREDTRLAALQALAASPAYIMNHRNLLAALDRAGIIVDDETLLAHLSWLEDRGAVEGNEVPPFTVVRLTRYGQQLVEGRASLDGVGRPPPAW